MARETAYTKGSDMDVQKTMDFILEQQAKTAITLDRLTEAQYNSEQRIARNEEAIEALIESQQRTDIKLDQLGEYINKVSTGLDHLKERVDALVLVVDSIIHRPQASQ
ncbi:MAG: hypothetical protein FJW38_07785 [Acidobacteria bacterium]|nr:hypothetical protein [Acidobacteriota bacterium]